MAHLDGSPDLALSTNGCQVPLQHLHLDALLKQTQSKGQAGDARPRDNNLEAWQDFLVSAAIGQASWSLRNHCSTHMGTNGRSLRSELSADSEALHFGLGR